MSENKSSVLTRDAITNLKTELMLALVQLSDKETTTLDAILGLILSTDPDLESGDTVKGELQWN